VPRPRINLLLYHGAFAPRGRCHEEPGPIIIEDEPEKKRAKRAAYTKPRHFPWAELLKRGFSTDILACPDCGGRLRLLATITQPAVIDKILTHLGIPAELPEPSAARAPEWLPGAREGVQAFLEKRPPRWSMRPSRDLPDLAGGLSRREPG